MVSLVPTSWEISSCVIARRARTVPFVTSPSAEVSSKNLANRSDTECERPMVRATPYESEQSRARCRMARSEASAWSQKPKHLFPSDEIQLARLHGFNRQLIGTAGNDRMQSQTSPASAIRIMSVLPSREVVESFALPWQSMKIPTDSGLPPKPPHVPEKRQHV